MKVYTVSTSEVMCFAQVTGCYVLAESSRTLFFSVSVPCPLQDAVWLLSVSALPTVDPHSPPLLWSGGGTVLESAPPSRPGSSCMRLCCLRVIVTFLSPPSWMDDLYCEHPALWLCLPSSRGHTWPWGTRSSKLETAPLRLHVTLRPVSCSSPRHPAVSASPGRQSGLPHDQRLG